jgi:ketol-acid reductoisomerase
LGRNEGEAQLRNRKLPLIDETRSGRGRYSKRLKQDEAPLIESTGRRLRAMMPWLQNQKT